MKNVDLVIIGGGPAGLAAAVAARKSGVQDILILERDSELGGILNQCIHNGFGLHTFKEELTGPEYAARFVTQVRELGIEYKLNTMVLDLAADKTVTAMNKTDGLFQLHPKAVILAMGCRERPRGALNIPGYRPAGIFTAGTAQRLVNMEGCLPGRRVVILGSGDIGLIMARRMTLEGAKVLCVAELMPYSGGLKRNIVQCLDDFGIPLKLSHTVVDIQGKERVTGITLARVENGKPVPGTEEHYDCDTLLLSCGLLPENELSRAAGVALNPVTGGPAVNESLETNLPGVFAAGNVLHVHDLVDYVSEEAAAAGEHAAAYMAGGGAAAGRTLPVRCENGVRYTVPTTIRPDCAGDTVTLRFRVGGVYKNKKNRGVPRYRLHLQPQAARAGPRRDGDRAAEGRAFARPGRRRDGNVGGGLTMEKRELICIGCPMGCPLTVTLDGGAVVTVQGNTCPRGDAYARREVTAPTRIVTTTVRVTGGTLPAVSCKTRSDIPKEKIFDVVRALKSVVVPAPVHIGQILLPDAAGTGVDVVATKDVAEV